MEETPAKEEETQQVLKVLEALKQASHELQTHPTSNSSSSSAIKALLELETEADSILSTEPHLSNLYHHLSTLRTLVKTLQELRSKHGIRSFLTHRATTNQISQVASLIESDIQAWIDRENIVTLNRVLSSLFVSSQEEDRFLDLVDQFHKRLSQGFDPTLQDLMLKSTLFRRLESILCSTSFSKRVREGAAFAITDLIKFNKDVFVGQILMGQTIRSLLSLGTVASLKILCELIKSIKSPLVDDIEANGAIQTIINFLSNEDMVICVMAMDCVLEIGYYGRKEAIEAMLNAGLIKKLVELQRSELGGDLIEVGKLKEEEQEDVGECERKERRRKRVDREMRYLEKHPFASCVARFAVQLEVGEGLRQREKRAFKQEILKRVREASVSDAEAATIIAEVLWGSSP